MADNEPIIESPKIESSRIDDSFKVKAPRFGVKNDHAEDEFDGSPGSIENSKSYDRVYNPEGENEQTNLLENANEIELFHLTEKRKARQARKYLADVQAQSQVQFWHGVGKFIIPEENTFMAHYDLVGHGATELDFNPQNYPLFDRIIANRAGIPALVDPNHPHYAEYEGLRDNIAVLRNFVFTDTFHDGSFDPGDELHVPRIVGIAQAVGQGIANDSWLGRVFSPALNKHLLKIPGEGAAEMYEYLHNSQRQPGLFSGIINFIMQAFGQPLREWDLPPISETPFSEGGLNAPSPQHNQPERSNEAAMAAAVAASVSATAAAKPQPAAPAQKTQNTAEQDARATADALTQIASQLEAKTRRFKNVADMDEPAREESVELAREILRKLRNMSFDDQDLEALLDQAAPKQASDIGVGIGSSGSETSSTSSILEYGDTRRGMSASQKVQDSRAKKTIKQAEKITQIIEIYTTYLEQARETRPDIAESPAVAKANEAIEEYIHSIKLMAAKEIPNSIASAQQIGAEAALDPAQWDELHNRASDRLMASIDSGMEELVSEMDQQEMDQQRGDDEVAQEATDAALMASDQQRRKRRRRKQATSGYGGKSQLKKHLALTADDYVLKQGAFQEAPSKAGARAPSGGDSPAVNAHAPEPTMSGLRMDDISAVRQLGNSLKQATETGKELQENLEKQQAEQRAQDTANPVAPQSATQALTSERSNPRRNNNRRTT